MTKSGRRDYESVRVVRWQRALSRRPLTWLLVAATFVGATLVVRSLVESAAQLRAALAYPTALARGAGERDERRVVESLAQPVTPAAVEPSLATPAVPVEADEQPSEIAPESLASAIERAAAAIPGPPSAYEFTRLLESGLLVDEDPAAIEELRRQLEAAAAR